MKHRPLRRIKFNRYHLGLFAVFMAFWIWAAIKPLDRDAWLLENLLVLAAVPLILGLGRYFQFARLSYTLIAAFLILHVIGSHYTYAQVPFGFTLQQWFHAGRNLYDRLVHFSFGFLMAYPVREIFIRLARVRGFWGYYLPLDVVLALSAGYEILEMLAALIVAPAAGSAFLGTQGDEWDAQKDMLAAGAGALIAMTIIAVNNWRRNPAFWAEVRGSFRLRRHNRPLGELPILADEDPEQSEAER